MLSLSTLGARQTSPRVSVLRPRPPSFPQKRRSVDPVGSSLLFFSSQVVMLDLIKAFWIVLAGQVGESPPVTCVWRGACTASSRLIDAISWWWCLVGWLKRRVFNCKRHPPSIGFHMNIFAILRTWPALSIMPPPAPPPKISPSAELEPPYPRLP
jgi:hypothetical protein